jgi:salicylate hydroxylase
MMQTLSIAGAGIAGLATALSAQRAGWQTEVFERAAVLSEVGAGVQLGPNVTRLLRDWGLDDALRAVAVQPVRLRARSVSSGDVVAQLDLQQLSQRYGAPYVTIHRADLHQLLQRAARQAGAVVHLGSSVLSMQNESDGVAVQSMQSGHRKMHHAQAGVVADGVWSALRQQLLGDGAPRVSGHLAYRAMLATHEVPPALRTSEVTVWMGQRVHVVCYPVCAGERFNVVCLSEGQMPDIGVDALQDWNAQKTPQQTRADLAAALRGACQPLRELVAACSDWRLWPLCDRPPVQGPHQQAQGRLALVGDAAHPMRPYLAQGAGMAIEDAWALGEQLKLASTSDVPARLLQYASNRWQRNARVQARAIRNGEIFHAVGPVRWGRDLGLRLLGARLMDVPWLYAYRA